MIKGYENRFYNFVKRQFMEYESNSYDYTELFAGFTIPYRPELFNEYMDILFEGKLFMIVKDYISYLETRYGKREFYRDQEMLLIILYMLIATGHIKNMVGYSIINSKPKVTY